MRKNIFLGLSFLTLFIFVSCSKSDDDSSLPSLDDKDDVCTAMDDLDFMKWCYDNYDINKDGKVSSFEAVAVREFIPGSKNKFKSIKGLEYFTGVEKLEISGTFTIIDLRHLHNLKDLYIDSRVTNYDFSNNSLLTNIILNNNNTSSNYSLDNPSMIITGFEKLSNPRAIFNGIVKMNEIDMTKASVSISGNLIVKNLILTEKQIDDFCNNTLEKDVIIAGETYHNCTGSNIYWQTINNASVERYHFVTINDIKNKLLQNGTTCTWEGSEITLIWEWGRWSDEGQKYTIIRFDRNSTSDLSGTGQVLYFDNSYKDSYKDGSEFTWNFIDDELKITYRHNGWAPIHAKYSTTELVIHDNNFAGTWYESSDRKYKFSYIKSSFNNWDKYLK